MSTTCCLVNNGTATRTDHGCSGSLRVRCGPYEYCRTNEVRVCPSVMSPETKRLLPPTTETVQTKPFPIRGKTIYYEYHLFFIACIYKHLRSNVYKIIDIPAVMFLFFPHTREDFMLFPRIARDRFVNTVCCCFSPCI